MTMQQHARQNTASIGYENPPTLFAFGLGYGAQALAKRLTAAGWTITGTVRSPQKAEALAGQGIAAHVFDGSVSFALPDGAHWLISVPPDAEGCPVFRAFQAQAGEAATITYLSTTGVYGDLQGGWAFEWTQVAPCSDRAKRRVLAEAQWASLARPFRTVRLPGIYGPGRSSFGRITAGTARRIIKPGQVFSRIHVEDLASGLEAIMMQPQARGVFHLCDDHPAPPQDVTAFAADLLGLAPPEAVAIEQAGLSPMARSFYAECKRVSNARAKSALGWFPTYRDYKAGLTAVCAAEQHIG